MFFCLNWNLFHVIGACKGTYLSTVISFLYKKDKWWWLTVLLTRTYYFMLGGSWKHVSYFLYEKYLKKNSFIPCPHWIKLENLVMQLKRQSVEAWQNEKHYSKGNNTSENPIPRQEISNQSTMWSTNVRSGQVRSQHLLFVQFSPWAFKLSCYLLKLL